MHHYHCIAFWFVPGASPKCTTAAPGSTAPENSTCVFPFEYNGNTYVECTDAGAEEGLMWCSTTAVYSGSWGGCKACDLAPTPLPTPAPPSPAPTPAPATCTDESLVGDGAEYRGCQNRTVLGYTCKEWSSTMHNFDTPTTAKFPNAGLDGTGNNYCRNPDRERTIWCYTTDPNQNFDFCSVLTTSPSSAPTLSPTPTVQPTAQPTARPTVISEPAECAEVSWRACPSFMAHKDEYGYARRSFDKVWVPCLGNAEFSRLSFEIWKSSHLTD